MKLEKHVIDTIKEWQLKIGYREGDMKLYYPGESLVALLGASKEELDAALTAFCQEMEPTLGKIKISGSFQRYCLTVPAKGCAYVAGKVPEPEFLKLFLAELTKPGNTVEQIQRCFADYAMEHGTTYAMKAIENGTQHDSERLQGHAHDGYAFWFEAGMVEEYVYWVEQNEFGITYHRFTREEYRKLQE